MKILFLILLSTIKISFADQCDYFRDTQDVIHIKANSNEGLYYCWGYFHAHDRLWQMDFFRKAYYGNRAKFYGYSFLKSDYMIRYLQLEKRSIKIWNSIDEQTKSILEAYSNGVNRYISEIETPPSKDPATWGKFNLILEKWKPTDTIGLFFLQIFNQTQKGIRKKIREEKLLSRYDQAEVINFFNFITPWETSVIESDELTEFKKINAKNNINEKIKLASNFLGLDEFKETGSNAWAISKQKSKTSNAWLANDPHLELRNPPFWHWGHYENNSLNVIGASFPGLPIIASGANLFTAWGTTNSYTPTMDLSFVENSKIKNGKTIRPFIWFKFLFFKIPSFFKTLSFTNDDLPILPLFEKKGMQAVLNWTGFDFNAEHLKFLFKLNSSKNVSEFDFNAKKSAVPGISLLFADTSGEIGFRATGSAWKLTERKIGVSTQSSQKLDKISEDEMPHLLNPKKAYLVNANNNQWPKGFKYYGGGAHSEGFRAHEIKRRLLKSKQDFDSFKEIQCDVKSIDASYLLPPLLDTIKEVTGHEKEIEILKTWNFLSHTESLATPIYRRWIEILQEKTLLSESFLFAKLTTNNDAHFKNLVKKSFLETLSSLNISSSHSLRTWGEMHFANFFDLSGNHSFDLKSISTPGDKHSINVGSPTWSDGYYLHQYGATQRLIVELSTPPRVYSSLAGPNSSKEDAIRSVKRWANCEYQLRFFPIKNWTEQKTNRLEF